jgi:hypothetical protein
MPFKLSSALVMRRDLNVEWLILILTEKKFEENSKKQITVETGPEGPKLDG